MIIDDVKKSLCHMSKCIDIKEIYLHRFQFDLYTINLHLTD